jgi:hypothetical protein
VTPARWDHRAGWFSPWQCSGEVVGGYSKVCVQASGGPLCDRESARWGPSSATIRRAVSVLNKAIMKAVNFVVSFLLDLPC